MTTPDPPAVLLTPPNTLLRIEVLWVFVLVDADGTERVCAATIGGLFTPLIGADEQRIRDLRPIARMVAEASGMTVQLIKLSNRTELEVIQP